MVYSGVVVSAAADKLNRFAIANAKFLEEEHMGRRVKPRINVGGIAWVHWNDNRGVVRHVSPGEDATYVVIELKEVAPLPVAGDRIFVQNVNDEEITDELLDTFTPDVITQEQLQDAKDAELRAYGERLKGVLVDVRKVTENVTQPWRVCCEVGGKQQFYFGTSPIEALRAAVSALAPAARLYYI